MIKRKYLMAFGLAGALAIGALSESRAAPVLTNTAAVKAALPGGITEVQWRGRGWRGGWRGGWGGWGWRGGGWWPGAVLGGVAVGAAVAASPYYYGYGYPYYGYGYPS